MFGKRSFFYQKYIYIYMLYTHIYVKWIYIYNTNTWGLVVADTCIQIKNEGNIIKAAEDTF